MPARRGRLLSMPLLPIPRHHDSWGTLRGEPRCGMVIHKDTTTDTTHHHSTATPTTAIDHDGGICLMFACLFVLSSTYTLLDKLPLSPSSYSTHDCRAAAAAATSNRTGCDGPVTAMMRTQENNGKDSTAGARSALDGEYYSYIQEKPGRVAAASAGVCTPIISACRWPTVQLQADACM